MKILITGNMGYVGPCVIRQLRLSYPRAMLVGLDTGFFAHCLTSRDILPECQVDLQFFGDVRSIQQEILEGTDAVVHLAAISNDPMGNLFENVTYEINHRGTVGLAGKAKAAGVRALVFASSCSMYGLAEEGEHAEDAPLNPLTAYAKSKAFAERDLKAMADRRFKITSLRFSTACGMSERLRLDLVLNDFVAGAITSKRITILSDGTPWRPLIDVRDMARAIDWAIRRGLEDDGPFLAVNVGSASGNFQVKELAEAVAEIIPGVDISINKNAQPDRRSYRVNFDLFAKRAPGFQPKTDLRDSIGRLRDGLEAWGFKDEDFRNSNCIRLKVLKDLRSQGLLTERLEWAGPHRRS